jgi:hypothetical protein
MKSSPFLLFLLAAGLADGALGNNVSASKFNQPQSKKDPGFVRSPNEAANSIKGILEKIPGAAGTSCLVNDFLDIVNGDEYNHSLDTQIANYGLVAHFKRAADANPELAEHAHAFYQHVHEMAGEENFQSGANDTRPYLLEEAGDANNEKLPAGWAWNLALKDSGGDPNLAMQLIGLCGHDDTQNGMIPAGLRNPEELNGMRNSITEQTRFALAAVDAKIAAPMSSVSGDMCTVQVKDIGASSLSFLLGFDYVRFSSFENYSATLSAAGTCSDPATLTLAHEKLQAYLKEGLELTAFKFTSEAERCPSASTATGFYLPKSLGANADISASSKKRLVNSIYNPKLRNCKGGSCLPAKYYHVYGAAAVACEMIARGHNPRIVTELAAASGWAYRVMWLTSLIQEKCPSEVNTAPARKENIESWSVTLNDVLHIGARKSCDVDTVEAPFPAAPLADAYANPQTMCDAAALLRHETVSGNLGQSLGAIYTNIPAGKLFMQGTDSPSYNDSHLAKAWGAKRLSSARQAVESIKADFAWTREQHRIGAKFAATVCKPDARGKANSVCR